VRIRSDTSWLRLWAVNAFCAMTMSAARAITGTLTGLEEPIEFVSLEGLYDAFLADMERIMR